MIEPGFHDNLTASNKILKPFVSKELISLEIKKESVIAKQKRLFQLQKEIAEAISTSPESSSTPTHSLKRKGCPMPASCKTAKQRKLNANLDPTFLGADSSALSGTNSSKSSGNESPTSSVPDSLASSDAHSAASSHYGLRLNEIDAFISKTFMNLIPMSSGASERANE